MLNLEQGVIEGVCNRPQYLDNGYLTIGSNCLRQLGTFTEQYALFSLQSLNFVHKHSNYCFNLNIKGIQQQN